MNWLGWAELIGGGVATAFGAPFGPGLLSAGVGTLATGKAKDQQLAAIDQAKQDLAQAYAPYTTLGAGAASLLGRGLGIDLPAAGAPMASAPAPAMATVAPTGQALGPGGYIHLGLPAPLPQPGVLGPEGTLARPISALGAALLPTAQRQSSYR